MRSPKNQNLNFNLKVRSKMKVTSNRLIVIFKLITTILSRTRSTQRHSVSNNICNSKMNIKSFRMLVCQTMYNQQNNFQELIYPTVVENTIVEDLRLNLSFSFQTIQIYLQALHKFWIMINQKSSMHIRLVIQVMICK